MKQRGEETGRWRNWEREREIDNWEMETGEIDKLEDGAI